MENVSSITDTFVTIGTVFYHIWWIVLPPFLYNIFETIHLDYVFFYSADSFHKSLKWMFLEIIPPRDIERSPKIMESIFEGISGVTTTYYTLDVYTTGVYTQPRFSVEIVSEEGKIHFYMRIQRKLRNLFEANIYSKYPGVEIHEVEDYMQKFPKVVPNNKWDVWGVDFGMTHEKPRPIRTWDKFEETVTGEIIDPLASLMEVYGSLGPNQYLCLQYVIEPLKEDWTFLEEHKKVIDKLKGKEASKEVSVFDDMKDVFTNVISGIFGNFKFTEVSKKEEQPLEFRLSPVEKEVLKATEENLGRLTYKTKMRFIYLSRKENFDKTFVSATIGSLKQCFDLNFNSLKPFDLTKTYSSTKFFKEKTLGLRKRTIYKRFRDRDMTDVKVWLSAKEMATLYHFPDMGVLTPAIPRVASKLGSAPPNLPIQ